MKTVVLRCSKEGCPRERVVVWHGSERVAFIESLCPWHETPGDFNEETYYDIHGEMVVNYE